MTNAQTDSKISLIATNANLNFTDTPIANLVNATIKDLKTTFAIPNLVNATANLTFPD